MMHFTCRHCGLGGDLCYLRFSKGHPTYHYDKRKMGEGIASVCWQVTPAPRPILNPEKDTCPEWRDSCGRDKATVERLVGAGSYVY